MKIVVLIPLYREYLLDYEVISISQNKRILKNYDLYFISPLKLRNNNKYKKLINKYDVPVHYFKDKFFKNIDGYNKLMLDLNFYKFYTNYDYMLICQLDAIVFKDDLRDWVFKGYDYIGAPWIIKSDKPYLDSMGNGGLSLRKIETFVQVLESNKFYFTYEKYLDTSVRIGLKNLFLLKLLYKMNLNFSNIKFFLFFYNINEDYFWAFIAKFFIKDFNLPSPETALQFSFEVEPKLCYKLNNNKLPFGSHAFQKYDYEFWLNKCHEIKLLSMKVDLISTEV